MTAFTQVDNSGASVEALKQVQQKFALQFEREKTALKFYLTGRGYHRAIKALGYIERLEYKLKPEERFRKDRVTPSLHHQVRIALSVTQLPGLEGLTRHLNKPNDLENSISLEEQCILNALLHDCQEDHDVSEHDLRHEFDRATADINWKLTKKFSGTHKSKEEYIREIALDVVAALDKGLDRCDNLEHMVGVFTVDKMEQYSTEAETVFLPMLKTASKLFPEVLVAFQAIMQRMKRDIIFAKQYVATARKLADLEVKHYQLEERADELSDQALAAVNSKLSAEHKAQSLQDQLDVKNDESAQLAAFSDMSLKIYKDVVDEINKKHVNLEDWPATQGTVNEILEILRAQLGISSLSLIQFDDEKCLGDINLT